MAPDGIPLDYGDQGREYAAALDAAILLDRSHEGRLLLSGRDRLALVQRMSTNDVAGLPVHGGAATIFTNATARTLFRAFCFELSGGLLLVSEAGQGAALLAFMRRSIFYGDQVGLEDLSQSTAQFALHGPRADAIVADLGWDAGDTALGRGGERETPLGIVTLARRKRLCGSHWLLVCARDSAAALHERLLETGRAHGLLAAGSLVYNCLRIRAGRPAGLELSQEYLPLEAGLWDEVSFSKGCYTGQEIIARMESRQRLAKTLVKVELSQMVAAPAPVTVAGRPVGQLTSSVVAPDGSIFALAILKLEGAGPGARLQVGDSKIEGRVLDYAGAQPAWIAG